MIQILLVFACEIQTSKVDESQRNVRILRDSFQKVLINDSEQLLTLQQIFLTPRQKNSNGFYLYVNMTVKGRDRYLNDSFVYRTSMKFEVLPPAADQDSTVQKFLNKPDISMTLLVLDPSFQSVATMLHYSDSSTADQELTLYMNVDNPEILLSFELRTDIHKAVYLTLSWVSLNQLM
jgi:hypothetical protein